MSKPTGATLSMLVFLIAVGAVAAILRKPLTVAFLANPVFNGLIIGVFAVGVLVNFRQALSLAREVAWIEEFRSEGNASSGARPPRLLAPMARMLAQKGGKRLSLSAVSMRTLLDGIRSRLEEGRDVGRYMTGLLIFLGLLGTFWGLLTTISAVSEVIGGLALQGGDAASVFETLKMGLRRPLSGMGTAFSTSLFGLSGALVLGFLDLQAGHIQNRFFNELEEWLAGLTRLASGALPGDAEGGVTAYVQALLEQTADSLDWLRRTLADSEQERHSTNDRLVGLSDQLARLTDQMHAEVGMLQTLAESHQELKPVLRRLADSSAGLDEASRAHLRNLDVGLARMREETRTAAERFLQEFRNEIRLLSRTVAASASGQSLPVERLE